MKEYIRYDKLMGSAFALGIVSDSESEANLWLQKGVDEIKRIEALLSEFRETSVTSNINKIPSGEKYSLPEEVFRLIVRCKNISDLSQGTFDITAAALKKIYSFNKTDFQFPDRNSITTALHSVGYKYLSLDSKKNTLIKRKPNMRISFNAIGKGYASDSVKMLWQSHGIQSGFINASGDLCAFGNKADGSNWQVSIANPDDKTKDLLYIPVNNQAVATSGDYEQFFTWEGKKYSHNINPLTGFPLHGIKSVTIVSPSAELSDALATAVYVMGKKKGIEFVNQLPNTYAIIIDEKNKIYCSNNTSYKTDLV